MIVAYHHCRNWRNAYLSIIAFTSRQSLCPLIYFLFLRPVDEYGRKLLLVFTVFKYGGHGQRLIRRHFQSFEVNRQFHIQVPIRQRKMLSGNK